MLRINKIWFTFSVVKIIYMLLALFVYAKFTSLGDTNRYLSGRTYGSEAFIYSSTHMMDFLAHTFVIFFGPVFANLPFVFLSIYGTYYAIKRLKLSNRAWFQVITAINLCCEQVYSQPHK